MQRTNEKQMLTVLGLAGLVLFFALNFGPLVFSEQNANGGWLPIRTDAARDIAIRHMEERGWEGPWDALVLFQSDTLLSGYLQKNEYAEEYDRRYGERYPIDRFQVELTGAESGKRHLVDVDMKDGRVLGWYTIEKGKKAAGAEPCAEDERTAAAFLAAQGHDPGRLEKIGNDRNDPRTLVFRDPQETVGEAVLTLRVTVADGVVTGYRSAFSVPEAYAIWQSREAGRRSALSLAASGLQFVLGIAALAVTILNHRHVDYRRGVAMSLIFLALASIQNYNSYPAYKTMQINPSEESYIIWFTMILSQILLLVSAASVWLSLVSGQAEWLRQGSNPWPRWHEPAFGAHIWKSMGRGYLLAFLFLGVQQIVLYALTGWLDAWTTNDPTLSTYNNVYPALFPLLAWAAAISEEAVFRLFGIAVFRKWLHSTAAAVIVTSLLWAFGHAAYPWYPPYTRVIEVTVLGLLFAWVFLRYGFATAVFAHAAFDGILMGISVMMMGGPANVTSGVLSIASPLLVAWVIRAFHSRLSRPRKAASPPPAAP